MAKAYASDVYDDRFKPLEEDKTFKFIQSMKNPDIKSKTISDCTIFTEWQAANNEMRRNLANQFRQLSCQIFFISGKLKRRYEPDTLKAIQVFNGEKKN